MCFVAYLKEYSVNCLTCPFYPVFPYIIALEISSVNAALLGFTLYLKTAGPLPEYVLAKAKIAVWCLKSLMIPENVAIHHRMQCWICGTFLETHWSAPRTCGRIFVYTDNLCVHQSIRNSIISFVFYVF